MRVNILMSTYNGEKYVAEQIDSILDQTYKDIHLYIRDDGSTDDTMEVLKGYVKDPRVTVYEGKNVGYGRSFLRLLSKASDGDYWAFSDQDDVWMPDKIERAVKALADADDGSESKHPVMYFHNFEETDEKLNKTSVYNNRIPGYSFQMAITECLHMGFATVINKPLRELMLRGDIEHIISHDWWAELCVMEFGEVITDDHISAKHRRLDSSVSSSSLIDRVKWFKKALAGNAEICYLTKAFMQTFLDEMKIKDKRTLMLFANDGRIIGRSIMKAIYPKRWRRKLLSEIVVRVLMAAGRI